MKGAFSSDNISSGAIRLQKFLAARGAGSRRSCEQLIAAGRVQVNGRPAELGMSVVPGKDQVLLDGHPVADTAPATRVLLLHKPRGYQCTAAAGRTVYDLLPAADRALRMAGRLDKDSEGLVLLANDGDLLQRVMHPRHGCVKTYRVTVSGPINPRVLQGLREPLTMEDGYVTRPADVSVSRAGAVAGRIVLEFKLSEGRNRQVRRLCERAGLKVHRLVRTGIGGLTLQGLRPGVWRELTPAEIHALG
ncbi:MAG: pseudouridine synthase [Kiritimatiellia bacterium]|jgi:23S rRNA pseudouridine2605 synthase